TLPLEEQNRLADAAEADLIARDEIAEGADHMTRLPAVFSEVRLDHVRETLRELALSWLDYGIRVCASVQSCVRGRRFATVKSYSEIAPLASVGRGRGCPGCAARFRPTARSSSSPRI